VPENKISKTPVPGPAFVEEKVPIRLPAVAFDAVNVFPIKPNAEKVNVGLPLTGDVEILNDCKVKFAVPFAAVSRANTSKETLWPVPKMLELWGTMMNVKPASAFRHRPRKAIRSRQTVVERIIHSCCKFVNNRAVDAL